MKRLLDAVPIKYISFIDCVESIFDFHFSDIKLSHVLWENEKISNIELFRSLCAENICTSVFALRVEDFYHSNKYLRNNFLALLSEIFVVCRDRPVIMASPTNTTTISHHEKQQPLLSKRSKRQLANFQTPPSGQPVSRSNGK